MPFLAGLSPLARGTPGACSNKKPRKRFIPAGAGNTRVSIQPHATRSVYPRWRGEHGKNHAHRQTRGGLSPLARGTLVRTHDICAPGRFIPAGAGNTINSGRFARRCPVYPRWRGEHKLTVAGIPPTVGLSPLARGTHYEHKLLIIPSRFIPAGAGNTRFACR